MGWAMRIVALCGLALVALTQMGAGCGDGLDARSPDACFFDGDCAPDAACVSGECRLTCTDDSECGVDQVCGVIPNGGGTVQACVFDDPTVNNLGGGECANDSECQANNERALCGVDGFCFVPETVSALLIEDATPSAAIELPEDGMAGADIAAVYLVDKDGIPNAFGRTLTARDPTGERLVSPITGAPPELTDDDMCVQGEFEQVVTSLGGEGGFMLVSFVDTEGDPVNTSPRDWRVVVIEWADNCSIDIEQPLERAMARGCESATYDSIDFELDCTVEFGEPFFGKTVLDPV
jgi:hypothetical protein